MWILYINFPGGLIIVTCYDVINMNASFQRYLSHVTIIVTGNANDIFGGVDVPFRYFTCTITP